MATGDNRHESAETTFLKSRWVQWFLYIVIWTVVGLLFASYSSLVFDRLYGEGVYDCLRLNALTH